MATCTFLTARLRPLRPLHAGFGVDVWVSVVVRVSVVVWVRVVLTSAVSLVNLVFWMSVVFSLIGEGCTLLLRR